MQSELTEGFTEQFWHVAFPITLLFVVAGFAVSVLAKKAEKFLVNFIRQRRGPRTSRKIGEHKIPEHAGVIEAPPCPQCGSKMVLWEARRGSRAGESFWGCSRYPGCRGTCDV